MHELDVSGKLDKASRAAVDALAELARGSRLRYLKLDGEPPLPVGALKGEVHAPSGGVTLSRRLLDDAAALVIARCVRGNTSLASLALRCDLQALARISRVVSPCIFLYLPVSPYISLRAWWHASTSRLAVAPLLSSSSNARPSSRTSSGGGRG